MPQENMSSSSARLLYKLLKALSLDTGAAIQQGPLGSSDPKLQFHCFTNTESPELLQFFLPEKVGLVKLRTTSPNAFDQEDKGCDLTPVYEALRNESDFDTYWKNCMEWVEGNLANSTAVRVYYLLKYTLPKSKEDLELGFSTLIKYERDDHRVSKLNDIFSEDPSVRNFMDDHGGGTVVLNEVTKSRRDGKDEIEAIVSITMIWLAQLGESVAGCTSFRNLLYQKIRLLFLEDDPRILEADHFHELSGIASHDDLLKYRGQDGSISKDDSMVEELDKNSPPSCLEILKNLMYNHTNHEDNAKRKTLERNEEM